MPELPEPESVEIYSSFKYAEEAAHYDTPDSVYFRLSPVWEIHTEYGGTDQEEVYEHVSYKLEVWDESVPLPIVKTTYP